MMTYRENLQAARDRYAAELAAQTPPPDYSWNEYEEFLLAQLERLDRLIASTDDRAAAAEGEVISMGVVE